jgi:hypothetical protein
MGISFSYSFSMQIIEDSSRRCNFSKFGIIFPSETTNSPSFSKSCIVSANARAKQLFANVWTVIKSGYFSPDFSSTVIVQDFADVLYSPLHFSYQ